MFEVGVDHMEVKELSLTMLVTSLEYVKLIRVRLNKVGNKSRLFAGCRVEVGIESHVCNNGII